jgi:hypothetical protein
MVPLDAPVSTAGHLPFAPITPKLLLQLRFIAPQRPVFAIEAPEGRSRPDLLAVGARPATVMRGGILFVHLASY